MNRRERRKLERNKPLTENEKQETGMTVKAFRKQINERVKAFSRAQKELSHKNVRK